MWKFFNSVQNKLHKGPINYLFQSQNLINRVQHCSKLKWLTQSAYTQIIVWVKRIFIGTSSRVVLKLRCANLGKFLQENTQKKNDSWTKDKEHSHKCLVFVFTRGINDNFFVVFCVAFVIFVPSSVYSAYSLTLIHSCLGLLCARLCRKKVWFSIILKTIDCYYCCNACAVFCSKKGRGT